MTTAKPAPKSSMAQQLKSAPKARQVDPVEPVQKSRDNAPTKEEPQEVKDRRKRRAISEKGDLTGKPNHPFARRNTCLIQARKANRAGDRQKASKLIDEAAAFAPLSKLELYKVNKP